MMEKEEEEKIDSNLPLKIQKEKIRKLVSLDSQYNLYKYFLNSKNNNNIIIEEIPINLNIIYNILRNKSFTNKNKAISIIYKIFEKLNESQIALNLFREFVLEKTFIFFVLVQIYISNNKDKNLNESLTKLLKCLLIGNVESIKIIMNLFPKTLFEKIHNDPEPINWINEWDDFFKCILQDYSEPKIVWNRDCREELIQYLENILIDYETSNNINKYNKNEEEMLSNINEINNKEINDNKVRNLNNINNENLKRKIPNYKNIKMNYKTLQNEIFVWKYYLKKLLKENQGYPSFNIEIENPKKLWKSIKKEIYLEKNASRLVIMIKVLILLYKNYYQIKRKIRKDAKPLGQFKDYDFFINLYLTTENIDLKSYIIQLLYVSITCQEQKKENRNELLNHDEISSIILSYIKSVESSLKNSPNSLNFNINDYEEKQCNTYYIDKDKDANKLLKDSESKFVVNNNSNFINYSNYSPIDEEGWTKSDDKYKMLSIIILLYSFLKKQLKSNQKDFKNDLPVFPIPKITKILYDSNNYKIILKLLLYDNLNLSLQTLSLFIYYIIDLQSEGIGSEFCLIDILFILMIKYKSSKLLRAIEKISNWYVKRNNLQTIFEDLNLTTDEIIFFNIHLSIDKTKDSSNKNKKPIVLLIRYFPIQIIYYIMNHNFEEFINLIYTKEEIHNCQIVWNRKMLEDLLKNLRNSIEKNKDKLLYDKKYRYDYSILNKTEKSCYLYYINDNYDKIVENIKENHYLTMMNILCLDQYLLDYNYVSLLHKLLEKYLFNLSDEMKNKIKNKITDFMCPSKIRDMAEDLNDKIYKDDSELKLLKHYIVIFSLIDETENDILKYNNNINLAINNVLSFGKKLNFNKEDKNAKILYILLNYLLEQPKIKNLLETLENEKDNDDTNSESINEKENTINNDNIIIQNQNEYDNISKMVQHLSRSINILFEINPNLLMSFLKYFTFLCEKDKNIINYINMTVIPLQLLRLCAKYKPNNNEEENKLYFTIFRALKAMVKNSQFLKEIMEKLLCNQRLMKNLLGNGTKFLNELTQGYLRPKSIWSNKDLEQLIKYLDKILNDFFEKQKSVWTIYNKIKESEKEQNDDEFKLNNIYIRAFNINPKQKHIFTDKEKEAFLSELIKEFIKSNNIHYLKHLLWGICNAMKYLSFDINFFLNFKFKEILNKYYKYVYHITHLSDEEKEQNKKDEEDDAQFYKAKDSFSKTDKKVIVCLQFIQYLSSNEETIIYFRETDMIYCFILLIENIISYDGIKIINNIMNNLLNYYIKIHKKENIVSKNTNAINNDDDSLDIYQDKSRDKRIKAVFLFLFKKLIFYTQNKKNQNEAENNQYIELFNIINLFANCKVFDLSLREMYKYYIPGKMVDNLFHSISPEQRNDKIIQKIFVDWLKDKIDFPDLKWNSTSFNRSYSLLNEDCKLILDDKYLIESFDDIYIETDRIAENKIFFECPDEYKIDAIYLRLFNKEPNYNIGHNLPNFLLHTIDDMIDNLEEFYIFCFNSCPNIDKELIDKYKKFKEKCLITSLTSVMLMIEQINFNSNNPNLILVTNKEINNSLVKKEEFKKEFLQIVKISFDYQQLLSIDSCKALIQMQKIIFYFDINKKTNEYKIYFNSEIRLIYLQILYLISLNKNRNEYLSENFEDDIIFNFYFNLLKHEKSDEIDDNLNINNLIITTVNKDDVSFVSDYEYVLICCLISQLITVDISHIPIILAQYLDDFILLSIKKPKIKKYIQYLFDYIEADPQYGDSLKRTKINNNLILPNEQAKINEIKIWRLECSDKKDVKYDKKNMHYCNYDEFIKRNNNKEEMKDYEFPIIFENSINYFKYDEYNDDIFELELKKITEYERESKNQTFISMKNLIEKCQSI